MRSFRLMARLSLFVLPLNLAGCGFTLVPPGFVIEHRHSVCRGWFDCNYLRRPSFTILSYDHLPPSSARVKLFRWGYGGSVEKPREIKFGEAPVAVPLEDPSAGAMVPAETTAPNAAEYLEVPGGGLAEPPPPLAPPSEIDEPHFGNEDETALNDPQAPADILGTAYFQVRPPIGRDKPACNVPRDGWQDESSHR